MMDIAECKGLSSSVPKDSAPRALYMRQRLYCVNCLIIIAVVIIGIVQLLRRRWRTRRHSYDEESSGRTFMQRSWWKEKVRCSKNTLDRSRYKTTTTHAAWKQQNGKVLASLLTSKRGISRPETLWLFQEAVLWVLRRGKDACEVALTCLRLCADLIWSLEICSSELDTLRNEMRKALLPRKDFHCLSIRVSERDDWWMAMIFLCIRTSRVNADRQQEGVTRLLPWQEYGMRQVLLMGFDPSTVLYTWTDRMDTICDGLTDRLCVQLPYLAQVLSWRPYLHHGLGQLITRLCERALLTVDQLVTVAPLVAHDPVALFAIQSWSGTLLPKVQFTLSSCCRAVIRRNLRGANSLITSRGLSDIIPEPLESAPGEPAGRNVGQGDAQAQANSLDGDTVDDRAMDDGAEDEGCAPESDAKLAKDGPSESDDTLEIKHRDLEKRVADVHHLLQAQQLAVELVANLSCSGEDDDWEDLDCSDASSDDLAADVAGTDMAEDDGDSNQYGLSLPAEVKDAFISNGLIPTVLAKVQGTDESSIDNLNTHSQGRKLVKGLCDLQLRSLLCVNNVVSLLDVEEVGGLDTLHTLWPTLSEMAIQKTVIENTALLEAVTSALRAVIQKLGELGSSKLLAVSDSDMQFLYEMALQSAEPNIRVNVVRIVSSLGCVLAKQPQAPPMLQSVGLFLLEAAARDQTLWVVAEALDALFDVFAEDSTNPIVSQIGLVHKLRDMFPALKTKVQQQRRHLGEHLPIVMMAKSNLTRFIKYKASHAGPT